MTLKRKTFFSAINVALNLIWCKIYPIMKHTKYYLIISAILLTAYFYSWKFGSQPTPLVLKEAAFNSLPGWKKSDVTKSFAAFQVSCKTFLKQNPLQAVGSQYLELSAGDWQPACKEAMSLTTISNASAKDFFKKWFKVVEFNNGKPVRGLFTGYYMPLLHGSLVKTEKYNVPLYGLPKDLKVINLNLFNPNFKNQKITARVQNEDILPYYTREEINKGAISTQAPVLLWVDNPIDRVFLEIQGSGVIQLENGKKVYVGYAGENGAPYTALAKVLIDKGVMTKDNASMQRIKQYLEIYPAEIDKVLNQNKSFVFFRILPTNDALGAQGVPLTPGYSLAVDRKWIPLGAPLWLKTTRPTAKSDNKKTLERLMIAQDTGGAIKGMIRGDVYWGAGEQATFIAGHMKNEGLYWLLLPRQVVARMLPHIPSS